MTYGLHGSIIAVLFGVMLGAYMISLIVTGMVQEKFTKYKIVAFGCFVCGIAMLLIGPCVTCQIPTMLPITIIGLFLYGIGSAISYIPILPLMIELSVTRYGY